MHACNDRKSVLNQHWPGVALAMLPKFPGRQHFAESGHYSPSGYDNLHLLWHLLSKCNFNTPGSLPPLTKERCRIFDTEIQKPFHMLGWPFPIVFFQGRSDIVREMLLVCALNDLLPSDLQCNQGSRQSSLFLKQELRKDFLKVLPFPQDSA